MRAIMKWPKRSKKNRRKMTQPSRFQQFKPQAGRFVAVGLLLVAATSLWSWALVRYDTIEGFDLTTVRIEGTFAYVQREDIDAVVAPYAHKGFFDIDVNEIRDRLERMPWVQRATVRRSWPDALEIVVFEQQAIARWGEQGLVNIKSELFYPDAEQQAVDLPQLIGVINSEKLMVSRLQEINTLLQPLGLATEQLLLDERRAWHVTLANGLQLVLGRHENMRRLQRFARVYPQLLVPRIAQMGSVDLRYANGFIVRWKNDEKNDEVSLVERG